VHSENGNLKKRKRIIGKAARVLSPPVLVETGNALEIAGEPCGHHRIKMTLKREGWDSPRENRLQGLSGKIRRIEKKTTSWRKGGSLREEGGRAWEVRGE